MEKAEAIERLEYLKARAQIALEQEVPEWIAEDVLGTIEAYDMAIEALQTEPNCSEIPNNCEDEPQKKEVEWVYNKRERLWYPYLNGELLFKDELNSSEKPNNSKERSE